jgi:hypothetical protein
MSGVVGSLMTFGGVLKIFDVFGKASNYLKRDVQVLGRENNAKCKQISRIISNIFTVIGHFCVALGMITMGSTLYAALPAIPFLGALNEGLIASTPYLIGSLSGLSLGLIIRQAAR